ncbi:hypothetical protein [Candidatus Albibeggiatoa sp. nov. NOAA]|uniref:TsoY family (seleno)protein n=1 Tax=Candidatus Albibeggiatoa sp. nov. NOAA TaxID=3162724 RepID=UPI003301CA38|nr:hypothetical protein [Thiotrichaceae bacterium]
MLTDAFKILTGSMEDFKEAYNPHLYLASVGFGGFTIMLYILTAHYGLNFTKNPAFGIVETAQVYGTFETWTGYLQHIWSDGILSTAEIMMLTVLVSLMSLIPITAIGNIKLLLWNEKQYRYYKSTEEFKKLNKTAGAMGRMARPFAWAMSFMTLFVVALVFVPSLWDYMGIILYIATPIALGIGYMAFRELVDILKEWEKHGIEHFENTNNFSLVLSGFAFVFIGIMFMSFSFGSKGDLFITLFHWFFATFFIISGILMSLAFGILGLRTVLQRGLNLVTGASLLVFVPIITIFTAYLTRTNFIFKKYFGFSNILPTDNAFIIMFLFTVALAIFALGIAMLRALGFMDKYLSVDGERNLTLFALGCPFVGMNVLYIWVVTVAFPILGLYSYVSHPLVYSTLILVGAIFTVITLGYILRITRNTLLVREEIWVGEAQAAETQA